MFTRIFFYHSQLKSKELLKSLEATESSFERNSVSGVIRCTICDVTVNSPQLLATHVAGNKHKSKKSKRENEEEGGTPAKKLCVAGRLRLKGRPHRSVSKQKCSVLAGLGLREGTCVVSLLLRLVLFFKMGVNAGGLGINGFFADWFTLNLWKWRFLDIIGEIDSTCAMFAQFIRTWNRIQPWVVPSGRY